MKNKRQKKTWKNSRRCMRWVKQTFKNDVFMLSCCNMTRMIQFQLLQYNKDGTKYKCILIFDKKRGKLATTLWLSCWCGHEHSHYLPGWTLSHFETSCDVIVCLCNARQHFVHVFCIGAHIFLQTEMAYMFQPCLSSYITSILKVA